MRSYTSSHVRYVYDVRNGILKSTFATCALVANDDGASETNPYILAPAVIGEIRYRQKCIKIYKDKFK